MFNNFIKGCKQYIARNKPLVLLTLSYFFLRLIFLDHAFLLRGERDIAMTGYFLAKTGRDLYGNFLPLELMNLDMPTPLLTFYYSALWWIIIPIKNVFFARLPYVFCTAFYIPLIYEMVKLIAKNKKLALLTALIFCFSPGMYHLSRLALEVNLATPLLFLGIIAFFKKRKIAAYVLFTLSFFTYNGFRPLILPLLLFLEFVQYLQNPKNNLKAFFKQSIIATIFFVVLFAGSYLFIDGNMMTSRSDDLVFLSYESISPQVIYRRNTALGPDILKSVFHNKITSTLYYMIEVFVEGQDLRYLFLKGDSAAIYASTFSGQFFLIMLAFYYLGFLYLGKQWKKEYFYILGFIPVGLIPSLVNIDYVSVTIRSILSTVGYAFILACGVVLFWQLLQQLKKQYRFFVIILLSGIVAVETAYFTYNYFLRRPVTMFEMFFESEKDVAQYLLDNPQNYYIYDDNPRNILATYYFLKDNLDVSQAQINLRNDVPYQVDGFTLRKCPPSDENFIIRANTIIAESCLDPDEYSQLEPLVSSQKINGIRYEDYSFRYAYFIFNSSIPESLPIQ